MAAGFDPYHRWLSIPPLEQPPTHYRLLGLQPFEASYEVIENAAERQITHVRSFLDSPLRPYAVNLIRELDVARLCLLDSEAKAAYDAWLEQRIGDQSGKPAPHFQRRASNVVAHATIGNLASTERPRSSPDFGRFERYQGVGEPSSSEDEQFTSNTGPVIVRSIVPIRSRYHRKSSGTQFAVLVWWILGAAIGLLAGYAVLCMIDPKYDFLHVMFPEESTPSSASEPKMRSGTATIPGLPSAERGRIASKSHPTAPKSQRKMENSIAGPTVPEQVPKDAIRPRLRNRPVLDIPAIFPLPTLSAVGETLLTTIPVAAEEAELALTLIQGSNIDEGRLTLVPEPSFGGIPSRWEISWTPMGDIASTDVATLSLQEDQLYFAWATDANAVAERATRNSLLSIRLYERHYDVALRAPIKLPALVVNLDRPVSFAVCKCEDPPEVESVCVEITDRAIFPPHRLEGQPFWSLAFGDECKLWYSEAECLATRVSLVKRGSRAALEIETGYRLPSGYEKILTIRNGNRKRQELNGMLAKLKSIRPPQNQSRSSANQNEISATERDLAALDSIAKVAQRLHEKVEVPFRFYFKVDGRKIDLAVSD